MCRALLPQHRETGSRNALAVLEKLVSLIGVWGHALECDGTPPPCAPTWTPCRQALHPSCTGLGVYASDPMVCHRCNAVP